MGPSPRFRSPHDVPVSPALPGSRTGEHTPGLLLIRLRDTGQAVAWADGPLPPLVVDVHRVDRREATEIVIRFRAPEESGR